MALFICFERDILAEADIRLRSASVVQQANARRTAMTVNRSRQSRKLLKDLFNIFFDGITET